MRKEGLGGSAPRQEKISHSKLVFFAHNNIRETKKSRISNLDFFLLFLLLNHLTLVVPFSPHFTYPMIGIYRYTYTMHKTT